MGTVKVVLCSQGQIRSHKQFSRVHILPIVYLILIICMLNSE